MKDTPYPKPQPPSGLSSLFYSFGSASPTRCLNCERFPGGQPFCLPTVCLFSSGQSLFPQEIHTMQGSLRISSLFSFLFWKGKNGDEPNAIWSQSNQFRTQVRARIAQFLVRLLSLSKQFCMANDTKEDGNTAV